MNRSLGWSGLARLRWIAILLPAGFVLVVQLVLLFVLEPSLPPNAAHALAALGLLAGVVVFALAIFRVLERQERTILVQAEHVRALHQVGADITAVLDADALTDLILTRAPGLLGADAAGLTRLRGDTPTMAWWQPERVGQPSAVQTVQLHHDDALTAAVLATVEPVAVVDTAASPSEEVASTPILQRRGLRSALAVPVRNGDLVLGVLTVANREPRAFGEEETSLLTSLANVVGIALANAELYTQAQVTAERLEQLIESSGDAIITTDLDGRILTWNHGAESIYGWGRDEAVGASLPMVPPDLLDDARDVIRRLMTSGETLINYETERLRKGGQRLAVVVTVSPVRNASGAIVGVLGISKDMSARRQLEEQQRRLVLFEDRERIGMELHDGAIQSLYAVGLGLEAVAQVIEKDPALARARLVQARDSVNGIIREIRNYIFGLRPDTFERQGLVAGIMALGKELEINGPSDVELDLDREADRVFPPEQAREVFQIAREALANVGRHAAASRVAVSLRPGDGSWTLRVQDNGVGMDLSTARRTGFGLGNMQERARRLGGALTLTSRPRDGMVVEVTFRQRSIEREA